MSGTALSADWQPSNDDRDYGLRRLHLTLDQIEELAEDMRIWAGANANRQIARKADWSLAFKGWMRREAKKFGGNGNGPNRSVAAAATRLIDQGFQLSPRPGSEEYKRLRAAERQGNLLPPKDADFGGLLPKR